MLGKKYMFVLDLQLEKGMPDDHRHYEQQAKLCKIILYFLVYSHISVVLTQNKVKSRKRRKKN